MLLRLCNVTESLQASNDRCTSAAGQVLPQQLGYRWISGCLTIGLKSEPLVCVFLSANMSIFGSVDVIALSLAKPPLVVLSLTHLLIMAPFMPCRDFDMKSA